jgi:molybdopterin converting factor small subunit
MTIQIKVLFFSVLRELAGVERITLSLGAAGGSPSLRDFLAVLYEAYPGLEKWDNSLLLAVNAEFATRDTLLSDGDEIALMPPVQGG